YRLFGNGHGFEGVDACNEHAAPGRTTERADDEKTNPHRQSKGPCQKVDQHETEQNAADGGDTNARSEEQERLPAALQVLLELVLEEIQLLADEHLQVVQDALDQAGQARLGRGLDFANHGLSPGHACQAEADADADQHRLQRIATHESVQIFRESLESLLLQVLAAALQRAGNGTGGAAHHALLRTLVADVLR